MKKLSLILNVIIFFIVGFLGVCFFSGLAFRFSNYIFPDHKSEIIFWVILALVLVLVWLSVFILVFFNNTEFITEKQKAYLFYYIMSCIFIVMLFARCRDSREPSEVLAIVKNPEKAIEVINFLDDRFIHISQSNGEYGIISYYGFVEDNNKVLIKLAENDLIDDNFIKDDYFEKFKSKYYYDKKFEQPKRLKKYVEREIKDQIKYIDGVQKVKVEFTPSADNQNSKFIIDIQISDNSNRDKIQKTINSLLSIYPKHNKIINISN